MGDTVVWIYFAVHPWNLMAQYVFLLDPCIPQLTWTHRHSHGCLVNVRSFSLCCIFSESQRDFGVFSDVIGPTQCDGIDRHTQTPSKSGTSASLILLLIAHEQLTSARICSELAFLLLSNEGYPSFFLDHLLLVCDRILHPLAACQPSKEVREVSYLEWTHSR